jgi:hypothetical protein
MSKVKIFSTFVFHPFFKNFVCRDTKYLYITTINCSIQVAQSRAPTSPQQYWKYKVQYSFCHPLAQKNQ